MRSLFVSIDRPFHSSNINQKQVKGLKFNQYYKFGWELFTFFKYLYFLSAL